MASLVGDAYSMAVRALASYAQTRASVSCGIFNSSVSVSCGTDILDGVPCGATASMGTYERKHAMGHGKRTQNGATPSSRWHSL